MKVVEKKEFSYEDIKPREADGYLNISEVCEAHGKDFNNWYCLGKTKKFLDALSSDIEIPISKLVEIKRGGRNNQGTWVHPQVTINIAQWLSPKFAVTVALWIDEWKEHSLNNKTRYLTALSELEPSRQMILNPKYHN